MRNKPQKAFRPSNKVIQGSIYSWGNILIKRRDVNILNKSLCFNRSDYSYNLLRIIGINPPFYSLDLSFHLIIGSNTVMGHSYIQHIRKEGILFICIPEITCPSIPTFIHIIKSMKVNITNIITIISGVNTKSDDLRLSSSYSSLVNQYIHMIDMFANDLSIPKLFLYHPPYLESVVNCIMETKSTLFLLPYLMEEISNRYTQSNSFLRVILECMMTNKSSIYHPSGYIISSGGYDDIFSLIVDSFNSSGIYGNEVINIKSKNGTEIVEAYKIIQEYLPQCNIEYFEDFGKHFYQQHNERGINISIDSLSVPECFPNKINAISNVQATYLSIIMCGKVDSAHNQFFRSLQRFVYELSESIKLYPLVSLEIIVVEYEPDIDMQTIYEELDVPPNIQNKMRFISVPAPMGKPENKNSYVFDYIARNVGIIRSKGEYILLTNPDIVLPIEFIRLLSNKLFSDGIVYIANQETYPMINMSSILKYTSITLLNHNASDDCPLIIHTFKNLASYKNLGCTNFLLTSSSLFRSVGGLPENLEGTQNNDITMLSNFFKLRAGFVIQRLPFMVFRSRSPKLITKYKKSKVIRNLSCYGFLQDSYDNGWGISGESFMEVVK